MINYPHILKNNYSQKTLISLSGSESDLRPQQGVGVEHAGKRRLEAIAQTVKGYNLLSIGGIRTDGYPTHSPKFFDVDGSGNLILNKDKIKYRLDSFVEFYLNLCQKNNLNPTGGILVGITDSALFAFYLSLFHHSIFKKVVLITPNRDFYFHLNRYLSLYKDDSSTKLSQFSYTGQGWAPNGEMTYKDILKSMNLFLYSKKDRFKYLNDEEAGRVQNSVLSSLEDLKRDKSNFYYHFKYEGISADEYRIKLDSFLRSPFKGKTEESNRFKKVTKSRKENSYA